MGQSLGWSELTHTHFLQQSLRILKLLIIEEKLHPCWELSPFGRRVPAAGAAAKRVGAFWGGCTMNGALCCAPSTLLPAFPPRPLPFLRRSMWDGGSPGRSARARIRRGESHSQRQLWAWGGRCLMPTFPRGT